MDTQLQDGFGRTIDYLRMSVTDRCDFRCVYCMAEDMTFLPRQQVLGLEELYRLAALFVGLGVKKIRLTGGEPLVRSGIVELCQRVAALPGLRELVMTSNGSQLVKLAKPLADAGVKRLNISLDSLDPGKFRGITRTGSLRQVLDGIEAARDAGFERIKLNTVVMKGRNFDEVLHLVDYAIARQLDISFIEEMPLGDISSHRREQTYCSSDEVRQRIEQRYGLVRSSKRTGGPSRYWQVAGSDTQVGFISPHSHNFCGDCNRVRVTAEGKLVLCLGHDNALDLRSLMRTHPGDSQRLRDALLDALQLKPERHRFDTDEQVQVVRFMSMTGG